jgi:hypothetical protein
MNYETRFLERLAWGEEIAQDEYDTICADLDPETLAGALVARFRSTGYASTLLEAARLFLAAGQPFRALEICSRYPHKPEFRRLAQKTLPVLRKEYPGTFQVGRLLEEAFIVVDLRTASVERFPPLMPANGLC